MLQTQFPRYWRVRFHPDRVAESISCRLWLEDEFDPKGVLFE